MLPQQCSEQLLLVLTYLPFFSAPEEEQKVHKSKPKKHKKDKKVCVTHPPGAIRCLQCSEKCKLCLVLQEKKDKKEKKGKKDQTADRKRLVKEAKRLIQSGTDPCSRSPQVGERSFALSSEVMFDCSAPERPILCTGSSQEATKSAKPDPPVSSDTQVSLAACTLCTLSAE